MEFLRIPVTFLLLFTLVVAHSNRIVWLLLTLAALLRVHHRVLLLLGAEYRTFGIGLLWTILCR